MRLHISIVALCFSTFAIADQGAAFQQGKILGDGANSSTFSVIGTGTVSDKVPSYGSVPSEAQLFQGGQGQLSGHGSGKIQSCATNTPGIDKRANQECEAVNFLARNPEIRPKFSITQDDPMIIGAKNARSNAESFFQSLGINDGAGASTQCSTKTETTPAQYTTEVCSSIKEAKAEQCTMGRTINIDSDANFQCDQTVNAYETIDCTRGFSANIVTVINGSTMTDKRGGSNPEYTMQTWLKNYSVNNLVKATLTYWIADNWGQLWVNDQLALDDTGKPGIDFRYGSVVPCVYDPESGMPIGPCGNYSHNIKKNGAYLTGMPLNRGCTWGCSKSLDITSLFKSNQSNKIEIVCGNSWSIGPCYYNITLEEKEVVSIGATVDNQCALLEERAK